MLNEEERFGTKIKRLRENRGISQGELAKILGDLRGKPFDQSYISKIENNEREDVKRSTVELFARAFNVDPAVFFSTNQPARPSIPDLLSELSERLELLEIPLRGSVPAGYPFQVQEERGEYITIPKQELGDVSLETLYALRIDGESLQGDGVHSGDFVIVDSSATDILEGRIYIIRLGNEVVARHIFKHEGYLRLKSSNGEYKDMKVTELEILGRVILSGRWEKH